MNADDESLVVQQIQLTLLQLALGVHPTKSVHGLRTVWKEAGQRGSMSLEELTELLAKLKSWSDEYADGWAKGYAEGWAGAILRMLEQRDVPMSDEAHGYISSCTDLKTLAQWLDLSTTATHWEDLIRAERAAGGGQSDWLASHNGRHDGDA